jgi:hypothetical protein
MAATEGRFQGLYLDAGHTEHETEMQATGQ